MMRLFILTASLPGLRAFIVLAVMSVAIPALAQDFSRESFKGIGAVTVVIGQDISADAVRNGLTPERLKTAVEVRLRRNGIPVADRTSSTFLYVSLSIKQPDPSLMPGLYVYSISVFLTQPVTVLVNQVTTHAITWEERTVPGTVGESNLRLL